MPVERLSIRSLEESDSPSFEFATVFHASVAFCNASIAFLSCKYVNKTSKLLYLYFNH